MKRIFQNVCVAVIVTALGSAAMAVNIKTVSVGNVGNTVDSTGYGAVGAPYGIGKYEVTAGQYTEFLNAVADTDTYGLYSSDMNSDSYGCQITRHGSSGNYTYDFSGRPSGIEADWVNRPVNYVSSGDAMRFANWLHNGQPTGAQGLATTEDGAYYLNGATSSSALLAVSRKSDWKWAITSEDEWYKAAYHKNDGVTGNYFNYPTGSDNAPSNALNGNGNNATFHDSGHTIGSPYYRTEVGAHVNSASPYGTFDQGGNLWEWNEATISGSYRGLRGGSFYVYGGNGLHASNREIGIPAGESSNIGFRVARAFDAPPQQPQRPDPTPPPAPSKSNLVLYTHGWNTSEFEFTNPNGSWGQLDTALRTAVGGSDWEVQGYGWTQDSGSPFTGPGYALAYAAVHGTSVGDQIGGNPNADYDNVHIIAHSAGSAFAAAAATRIQALSPDTNVHITLLDPYIGIGGGWFGGFWFGTGDWVDGLTDADWADNYFTRDSTGVLTELPLTHAHNVDVTRLDPNFDPVFLSSHGWPVEWYTETVNGTPRPGSNGYGFPLSVEGGGWNPSAYPVGNDPAVLGGGSSEPTDIVSGTTLFLMFWINCGPTAAPAR